MIIKLSPQRRDYTLSVVKIGKSLTINGEVFDFTCMDDGDTLPRAAIKSEWFVGDVDKADGELTLTLLLPNPWNCSPEQAFPVDIINVPDGPIIFPQPLPDQVIEAQAEGAV